MLTGSSFILLFIEMLKQLKSQGYSSNVKHGETEGTVENRIIYEMD